jgi:hypothetical protein
MFLATSANFPEKVVVVLWLVFGSTVAKVAEAWKKTNQSFRDWGRVRCSMWWNS